MPRAMETLMKIETRAALEAPRITRLCGLQGCGRRSIILKPTPTTFSWAAVNHPHFLRLTG